MCSNFAMQINRIEKGLQKKEMLVGNLKAVRDFTDVRDMVKGYWLSLAKGKPGEVYTRICDKQKKITSDCFTIAPISPLTKRSVRLRNTSMETFQIGFAPLDGNTDPLAQKSSVGCMQCHNLTGVDASFAWVDAAEEVVPIGKQ